MLKFDHEHYQNLIETFNDQKKVSAWAGVYTNMKYSLLDRATKVACIIDTLIRKVNNHSVISTELHLEAIRLGMYEDMPKVSLNEISHSTKQLYPKLANMRKNLSSHILKDMNLDQSDDCLFIAKIGDILNSYFESKIEQSLGSKDAEILNAGNNAYIRMEKAKTITENTVLKDLVIAAAFGLMSNSETNDRYINIIDTVCRQTQIKRWARRITLNNFTLLEHSGRVACLVDCFIQVNKTQLKYSVEEHLNHLRYALYHDYPEVILNDTPSPIKKLYPEMDVLLKDIEDDIMNVLDLKITKTSKLICKIADIYDCLYEAKQEKLLGNNDNEFAVVIDGYNDNFATQLKKYPKVNKNNLVGLLTDMFLKNSKFN